jgi:hypothetical protein
VLLPAWREGVVDLARAFWPVTFRSVATIVAGGQHADDDTPSRERIGRSARPDTERLFQAAFSPTGAVPGDDP